MNVSHVRLGCSLIVSLVVFSITTEACAQESSDSSSVNSGGQFAAPYNSEKVPGDPISPQQALEALQLPNGFSATLFAAEPDVMNPIAACTDPQGRVWVAENFTYAEREQRFDLNLSDRVIVLEDRDGDGVSEKRTVFKDDLKILTGITVGRGGVWLMAPPQLLFVPDQDGDLVPDGPAEVRLDGFHLARENYHNFANGLSWGPDGWLYGRCGASGPGEMGLPGATDEQRIPLRGGMWRYHPETKAVEALVQGTTNPWGNDWNEYGDLFFINTVNGHFWHCIPGAHYVRPHTLDVNPQSYELIDMHADHWHFDTGKSWTASRDGAANDYGGGHAHIGMTIYQEGRWPEQYQNRLMTVNMHGRRINVESLHREGGGYVASHEPDFVLSNDEWFRGMEILPLPDGNVLLIDWSDTGECHEHTGVHRTSGRIFKIIGPHESGGPAALRRNAVVETLEDLNLRTLLEVQDQGAEWHSRRARELLTQHVLSNPGMDVSESIQQQFALIADESRSVPRRLRAVWSALALGCAPGDLAKILVQENDEYLRGWGVRLLVDRSPIDTVIGNRPWGAPTEFGPIELLRKVAANEQSAKVRLELASALQRMPHAQRGAIAEHLVTHDEDAGDHNLPLMIWYGISPLADGKAKELLELLNNCEIPTVRRLIARRLAERAKVDEESFAGLFLVGESKDIAFQMDLLEGISAAFAGWRKVEQPPTWKSFSTSVARAANVASRQQAQELRDRIQSLNILFGDGRAVDELKQIAMDGGVELESRKSALQTLVDSGVEGTKEICLKLLDKRFLNTVAVAGLGRSSDPEIGKAIVSAYRRFHPSERPQAISVLTTRAPWAVHLLEAVGAGRIDPSEISAFQARQMSNLEDKRVEELLVEQWGQVRVSDAAKRERIAALKTKFTSDFFTGADLKEGRLLFQKTCSSCHKLYGAGGELGPDLTGAQRSNMDYLLDNIVDPSAVVTKEFRATRILMEDDRVLTGLVTEKNDNVVTLATQDEVYKLDVDEISDMRQSAQSTMPEGLLDALGEKQLQSLFAYLQSSEQVPLD
ncbi:MAG: PVC-type heme-binding CxxCH protein [Aureliella sp.]